MARSVTQKCFLLLSCCLNDVLSLDSFPPSTEAYIYKTLPCVDKYVYFCESLLTGKKEKKNQNNITLAIEYIFVLKFVNCQIWEKKHKGETERQREGQSLVY